MIRSAFVLSATLSFVFAAPAFAQAPAVAHPCEQIESQCKAAGFIPKTAKVGTGLWKDCVGPIMTGAAQPAGSKIALPTVDPTVVAACKTKNPNFGEGKKH